MRLCESCRFRSDSGTRPRSKRHLSKKSLQVCFHRRAGNQSYSPAEMSLLPSNCSKRHSWRIVSSSSRRSNSLTLLLILSLRCRTAKMKTNKEMRWNHLWQRLSTRSDRLQWLVIFNLQPGVLTMRCIVQSQCRDWPASTSWRLVENQSTGPQSVRKPIPTLWKTLDERTQLDYQFSASDCQRFRGIMILRERQLWLVQGHPPLKSPDLSYPSK